jgi:TRAP-type mannitol/chloroaromatic compound transport system permease small subunit
VTLTGVAIALVAVPLMIALAAIEPVARWLGWNAGASGDAATAAFLALVMTSFGYAYAARAHVRLDLLSRRLSPRCNAWIELGGSLLVLVPLCAVLVLDGTESAWRSFQLGERWADTGWPVQWLLRAWIPAGFLLLLLAALASALRALSSLRE